MKIKTTLETPKTKEGNDVQLSVNRKGGGSFFLTPIGSYTVVIRTLQQFDAHEAIYESNDGEHKFLKLRPIIHILKTGGKIDRQDFVVGFYSGGSLYNPNPDNSVVWGGMAGAQSLLASLGLFTDLGDNQYELDLDTDNVQNRIVRASIGIAGYVKERRDLTDEMKNPFSFNDMMITLNGGKWEVGDLQRLIPRYNDEHDLSHDAGLKSKNVVIKFFGVDDFEIEDNPNWIQLDSYLFLSQRDADKYSATLDGAGGAW